MKRIHTFLSSANNSLLNINFLQIFMIHCQNTTLLSTLLSLILFRFFVSRSLYFRSMLLRPSIWPWMMNSATTISHMTHELVKLSSFALWWSETAVSFGTLSVQKSWAFVYNTITVHSREVKCPEASTTYKRTDHTHIISNLLLKCPVFDGSFRVPWQFLFLSQKLDSGPLGLMFTPNSYVRDSKLPTRSMFCQHIYIPI